MLLKYDYNFNLKICQESINNKTLSYYIREGLFWKLSPENVFARKSMRLHQEVRKEITWACSANQHSYGFVVDAARKLYPDQRPTAPLCRDGSNCVLTTWQDQPPSGRFTAALVT